MNKEILNEQLMSLEARNHGLEILVPGKLSTQETAAEVILQLNTMYIEHGITKDKLKLEKDIDNGNVLSWFAKKDGEFVATASLVKQPDGAWELGRAVSSDRGNGIGKKVILEALKFHLESHPGEPLTAEVRIAAEFEGIPSGIATQKIFFGTIDKILPITPFAVAPLFSHGNPLRNELFVLSASDVKPGKTISEKIAEVTNNRSTRGTIPRVKIVHTSPFQLIVPNNEGVRAIDVLKEVDNFDGCTLFPIETTDKNMPLIGMLSANKNMVVCGVDRVVGREGKPVLLIAEVGFGDHFNGGTGHDKTLLSPSVLAESLPPKLKKDIEEIADKFLQKNLLQRKDFRIGEEEFWASEFEHMNNVQRDKVLEDVRKKEEIWEG